MKDLQCIDIFYVAGMVLCQPFPEESSLWELLCLQVIYIKNVQNGIVRTLTQLKLKWGYKLDVLRLDVWQQDGGGVAGVEVLWDAVLSGHSGSVQAEFSSHNVDLSGTCSFSRGTCPEGGVSLLVVVVVVGALVWREECLCWSV